MGLDKYLDRSDLDDIPPLTLNESYIEYALIRLFMIDVVNLAKVKAILTKEFHISPNEIDKMTYWEYELWMDQLNEMIKEDNEKQQSEMKKYHVDDAMKMATPGGMNKMMSAAQPKMPSMPNFGSMRTPF